MNPQTLTRYGRSMALHEAAQGIIPGGVNSNVRLRSQPVPLFFRRASGARLWDVDGNEYLDFSLGMGAIILGHADPAVVRSVASSLDDGQLFAGQHQGELDLARLLSDTIPWMGMVRLAMSGTEADQAAIRLARAATGRTRIVKFEGHYHGWSDGLYLSSQPSIQDAGPREAPRAVRMSAGQPQSVVADVVVLPWNDSTAFRACLGQADGFAAVIMEPILCNTALIPPDPMFIELVRDRTAETGAILVFDEVITGFRVGIQGAAARLSVTPDLVVYAKALGNGVPIACFGGRPDLMRLIGEEVAHHAGTYNGNRISVSAALATVGMLRDRQADIYPKLEALGARLASGLRQAAANAGVGATIIDYAGIVHSAMFSGPAPRDYRDYVSAEDYDAQRRFVRALQDRGVRVTNRGTWFLCASHGETDIDWAIDQSFAAFRTLSDGKKQ